MMPWVMIRNSELPVEINLRVVVVLRLAWVAPGERTEEGVGQQAGNLFLGQSQGLIHVLLKQGDRLQKWEGDREREENVISLATDQTGWWNYIKQMARSNYSTLLNFTISQQQASSAIHLPWTDLKTLLRPTHMTNQ